MSIKNILGNIFLKIDLFFDHFEIFLSNIFYDVFNIEYCSIINNFIKI